MKKFKIVDSVWFGKIGIVKLSNGYQAKWYIGHGMGKDQKADEKYISENGVTFDLNALTYFFNNPTI